eukprot:CAMPEP_0174694554 /NCGR_PEP_ID=MMETSP1094-20130205/1116_1 /TAXON_ID=156173 /ORGANISM="Chrysochromulina brevifilum, Strain UTEX LB 985" /LENGTH=128 /DNA_ID=CAMNT_0015890821 /DNA_START=30 /DNA_END=416 /DNA_ORIENTATION=+
MSFKRFVEVGRVALVQYGEDSGKLCTIINVIDNNRVLVDGPAPLTGVSRKAISIKRLMLTDIKVAAKLNANQKQLMGLWESEGVQGQWDGCSQAKKRKAHAARASMTDFDRFQVQLAKTERSAKRQKA